jgi:Carbamoyltransferase N-terminus
VQEERFTRVKQDASFPRHGIGYCLEVGALTLDQVDYVVFYEKPFLKFERLLETYVGFAPRGLTSFVAAIFAGRDRTSIARGWRTIHSALRGGADRADRRIARPGSSGWLDAGSNGIRSTLARCAVDSRRSALAANAEAAQSQNQVS